MRPWLNLRAKLTLEKETGSFDNANNETLVEFTNHFRIYSNLTANSNLTHVSCLLPLSVSTFGAVLDMVTDKPSLVFLSLLALDIASHWLQMYSFALYNFTGSILQVVVESLTNFSPLSLLLALSIFGWSIKQIINVIQVNKADPQIISPSNSTIVMKTAADVCVLYDIEKQHKR
ncbi:hypothetical protein YC2023_036385 [Brassica napus]